MKTLADVIALAREVRDTTGLHVSVRVNAYFFSTGRDSEKIDLYAAENGVGPRVYRCDLTPEMALNALRELMASPAAEPLEAA